MKKLQYAILYILAKQKDESLNKLPLAKLLYLSDYVYAKSFGSKKPFTGSYLRLEYGPVPVDFYRALRSMEKEGLIKVVNNSVILKRRKEIHLSLKETASLDKTISSFNTTSKAMKAAYATEPMVEIKKKEQKLSENLIFEEVPFEQISTHPLLKPLKKDLSYLESEEYKKSLQGA